MSARHSMTQRIRRNRAATIVGATLALIAVGLGGYALLAHIGRVLPDRTTDGAGHPSDSAAPVADFAEIVAAKTTAPRASRLAGNERILVIDFPNLLSQGRALNRLAVLIEKRGGPRDRVLNDVELANFIRAADSNPAVFYFGHDYRAADIVHFFNLAESGGITLNVDELALRDVLIRNSFMRRADADIAMVLPERALVTVAQLQPDDPATEHDETVDAGIRDTTLRHELSHGAVFTNNAYRDYSFRFWRIIMTDAQRQKFRAFIDATGYDTSIETVLVNEMQAFLAHTPDPRAFSAAHLGVDEEELTELQRRFEAGAPPTALPGMVVPDTAAAAPDAR